MLDSFWKSIIDEQVPDQNYDVGLMEEIAQSAGCTVKQIEDYLEKRKCV